MSDVILSEATVILRSDRATNDLKMRGLGLCADVILSGCEGSPSVIAAK